jgi:hypothetical protein
MDNPVEKPENRHALYQHFKQGRMPTEESFRRLIDSSVNKLDDKFSHDAVQGLQLGATTAGADPKQSQRLLSFYRGGQQLLKGATSWFVGLLGAVPGAQDQGLGLAFAEPQERPEADPDNEDDRTPPPPVRLYLAPGGRVGIGTTNPSARLSVDGFVSSVGRTGTFQNEPGQPGQPDPEAADAARYTGALVVPANGEWHPIIQGLRGLWSFEITAAAYGPPTSGNYALAHGVALGVHGQQQPINLQEARYGSWRQRIELRWFIEAPGTREQPAPLYGLKMRTRKNFGRKARIFYHITCLFQDVRALAGE